MKILLVHNYYQNPGGEDRVFADEYTLLSSRGHDVEKYTVHNDSLKNVPAWRSAINAVWNGSAAAALAEVVKRGGYDVVHFHNTFPLLSPAVYQAVRKSGAAVVQTLHNFRLLCAGATLYRNGKICEQCVPKSLPWPALVHRCYRGSLAATTSLVSMQVIHKVLGTYSREVDAFVALTEFSKQKLIEGGLPKSKMHVKPNFMTEDPVPGDGGGAYILFVGRLSEDKGVHVLLNAWKQWSMNQKPELELRFVGDGPCRADVEQAAARDGNIRLLGWLSSEDVHRQMSSAEFLVMPSLWYEGFPKTLIEAMSLGTPTVASRIGSLANVIQDGINGFLFQPGNVSELCQLMQHLTTNRERLRGARDESLSSYRSQYTAEANYPQLMTIYEEALRNRWPKRPRQSVDRLSELNHAVVA